MARSYYSVRTGRNKEAAKLSLDLLKSLFRSDFMQWDENGYFQEAFGKYCVDAHEGHIPGTLGSNVHARVFLSLRKQNLWPVEAHILDYSEDDLFDVIEFLFDQISKPSERDGFFHNFASCGWHYNTFDQRLGRQEYRERVNALLRDYGPGYELDASGEVLELAPLGMEPIFSAKAPSGDSRITDRISSAVTQFRRRGATIAERRIAVRELADVLELLRPKIQGLITRADEADLFTIANGFGIRHNNDRQKIDYDHTVWLSWMFYYYLATVHACLHLLERSGERSA